MEYFLQEKIISKRS